MNEEIFLYAIKYPIIPIKHNNTIIINDIIATIFLCPYFFEKLRDKKLIMYNSIPPPSG
jgi:hypothetical protein